MACSSPFTSTVFEKAAVAPEEAHLGGAVAAFYVGPAHDEMSATLGAHRKPGYVVLVRPDGAITTIETAGMDLGSLAWNEHGLHFSDDERDYRLDDAGLTTVDNAKPASQNLIFALETGETVGVYNDGHTEGGYVNQVAVSDTEDGRTYTVEGNYYAGADCDGRVLGLAADPGAHAAEAAALPGMQSAVEPSAEPQMLAQLYPPTSGGHEEVIAWRDAFDVTVSGQLPCQDSSIVFLANDTDANGQERATVVTWNADTGESRTVPVTFTDTAPLDPYTVRTGDYNAFSLADDHLEWVAADGRVFSTAIDTGATTTVFDTGLEHEIGGDAASIWTFSESKIHAVNQDYADEDASLTYHEFDRATGAVSAEAPIAIKSGEINVSYLNWWRMAVAPR
jgi:hypothetical protein